MLHYEDVKTKGLMAINNALNIMASYNDHDANLALIKNIEQACVELRRLERMMKAYEVNDLAGMRSAMNE